MAVFRKILGLALATTVVAGFSTSSSAAVQVVSVNGGAAIFVPPAISFSGQMTWAPSSLSDSGIVQFDLGSALTLTSAGFTNSGVGSNIFSFASVHLYSGWYQDNGNSLVGLAQVSTGANESVANSPGGHLAKLLPTDLAAGKYSLVYSGATILAGGTGARVDGNISFEAPAVPEAATWMMMVAGFGLMGAAMRRRPRTQVSFA